MVKEVVHNDYPIRVKVVMSKAGKEVPPPLVFSPLKIAGLLPHKIDRRF